MYTYTYIIYSSLSLSQSWVIFVWFVSVGFPAVLANVLLLPAGEHLYLMIVHSDFSDFEFALLVSLTNIIPPTRIPSNNETNDETPVHWQIHHISAMCFFWRVVVLLLMGGPPKLARWHSWRIRIFTIIYFPKMCGSQPLPLINTPLQPWLFGAFYSLMKLKLQFGFGCFQSWFFFGELREKLVKSPGTFWGRRRWRNVTRPAAGASLPGTADWAPRARAQTLGGSVVAWRRGQRRGRTDSRGLEGSQGVGGN